MLGNSLRHRGLSLSKLGLKSWKRRGPHNGGCGGKDAESSPRFQPPNQRYIDIKIPVSHPFSEQIYPSLSSLSLKAITMQVLGFGIANLVFMSFAPYYTIVSVVNGASTNHSDRSSWCDVWNQPNL